jgi:hypothetical protein
MFKKLFFSLFFFSQLNSVDHYFLSWDRFKLDKTDAIRLNTPGRTVATFLGYKDDKNGFHVTHIIPGPSFDKGDLKVFKELMLIDESEYIRRVAIYNCVIGDLQRKGILPDARFLIG